MLTFIVTGAAGHLGITLLHKLENSGNKVRALIHRNPGASFADPNFTYIKGDIRDKESLRPLFEGVDGDFIVVHGAATIDISSTKETPELRATNLDGTRNLFELFEEYKGKRFIYVGTADAFKESKTPVTEDCPLYVQGDKAGGYQLSKTEATNYIKMKQQEGKDAVIIYPTAIMGPYDLGKNPMVQLLKDYVNGKIPGVIPGGYDVVDMRDVASSIVALSFEKPKNNSYITSGEFITLKEIMDIARAWTGNKAKRAKVFPIWLTKLGLPFISLSAKITKKRPLYTSFALRVVSHANRYDYSQAKKDFGYTPRKAKETVISTLEYLKENKAI